MCVADVWLVASDLLQTPNNTLVAAVPLPHSGLHLPQLQSELFGSVCMGYGDLFVAGAAGGRAGPRRPAAVAGGAADVRARRRLFDLLFFVLNELPATVPVARP